MMFNKKWNGSKQLYLIEGKPCRMINKFSTIIISYYISRDFTHVKEKGRRCKKERNCSLHLVVGNLNHLRIAEQKILRMLKLAIDTKENNRNTVKQAY